MPKKQESLWLSGLAINLASNLIAFVVGGTVTYFSKEGSIWIKPLLFGGAAWLITFCSILAVRFMARLPRKVEPITVENIGSKLRDWLDEFNLTVKSVREPDTDFFYIVTTDGGKKISISRSTKTNTDYLSLRAILTATEEEKAILGKLTTEEHVPIRLQMQVELSRAVIGYWAEKDMLLDGLTIFKQIPITETLTTANVLNVMWEIEAMVGTLYALVGLAVYKHNAGREAVEEHAATKKQSDEVGPAQQPQV